VPDTPVSLSAKLSYEGEKTLTFFSNLRSEQLERIVYSEGDSWSVRHILAHFVSAEIAFLELITDVIAGGKGAPEGFDIDSFNHSEVSALQDLPASDLIDQFHQVRRQTARIVEKMKPEQLNRTARHPFLGVAPLVDIIRLIYRHNQIHLRDVRSVIGPK
jgi:hypothetical protein